MASQQGDNNPGSSSRSGNPEAPSQNNKGKGRADDNPTSTAKDRGEGGEGNTGPGQRHNPIDVDNNEESSDLDDLTLEQRKDLDDMQPFFPGLSTAQRLEALRAGNFDLPAAMTLLVKSVSAQLRDHLAGMGFHYTLKQCTAALDDTSYFFDDAAGRLIDASSLAASLSTQNDLHIKLINLKVKFSGLRKEFLETILEHSGGDINVAIRQVDALVEENNTGAAKPISDEDVKQLMMVTKKGQQECVAMLEKSKWDVEVASNLYFEEELAREAAAAHANQTGITENEDDLVLDSEEDNTIPTSEPKPEEDDDSDDGDDDSDDGTERKSGRDDQPPPPPPGCPPSAPQGKKESDGKEDEDRSGAGSKRKASGPAQVPDKRARVDKALTDTLVKSISGILIKFDGTRSLRVPKSLLNKITYFQKIFQARKGSSLNEPIKCQMPAFVFRMILDWIETGQINIDEEVCPRSQLKLDAVVTFLGHAINLGVQVHQPPNVILGHIKEYLIENREALRASHIRLAFGYHKPGREPHILKVMDADEHVAFRETAWKPIQEMFVKSATRLLIEYREDPLDVFHTGPVYTSDDEGINEAKRNAFKRGFRYDRKMEVIPEFRLQLLILLEKTNRMRTDKVTKSGKTLPGCYFLDPLTMERFDRD